MQGMNSRELQAQIERAHFPPGVTVSGYREEAPSAGAQPNLSGLVLRLSEERGGEGYGFEVLLTDSAAAMYGAGPALTIALEQLKKKLAAGLPPVSPEGSYERVTFVGD